MKLTKDHVESKVSTAPTDPATAPEPSVLARMESSRGQKVLTSLWDSDKNKATFQVTVSGGEEFRGGNLDKALDFFNGVE